jgi:hypothetical protein
VFDESRGLAEFNETIAAFIPGDFIDGVAGGDAGVQI